MSGPITSELIFTSKSSIERVVGDNVISNGNVDNKANIIDTANIQSSVSGIRFFTPGNR